MSTLPAQQLPGAPAMEQSLLSCVMQSSAVMGMVKADLQEHDFIVTTHWQIWEFIRSRVLAGKPVDPVSLMQSAEQHGKLEQWGGAAIISEIYTAAANPGQAGYFAGVILELSRRRALVRACWDTAATLLEHGAPEESDLKTLVEGLEGQLLNIMRTSQHSRKGQRSSREVVCSVLRQARERYRQRGQPLGLTLGFPDLDRVMNGLQAGDFCVVAARPAMGKTSLATAFAEAVAADACNRKNRPVLLITLEMSDESIGERSVFGRARITTGKARTGMFSDAEGAVVLTAESVIRDNPALTGEPLYEAMMHAAADKLEAYWKRKEEAGRFQMTSEKFREALAQMGNFCRAASTIASGLITFYDGYAVTSAEVRAEIRKWVKKIQWEPGADPCVPLVILDYIQLVKATEKKAKGDPRLALNEICEVLKGAAKEFGIAVMPLAQVGRGAEENAGKMPMLKDLKESGAIEEYADYVLFIHRPSYYSKWDKLQDKEKEFWEAMAKKRNDSDARARLKEDAWSGQTFYEAHASIGIRKARHCGTADVDILFRGEFTRFSTKTPALFSNNRDNRQQTSITQSTEEEEIFD